MKSLYIAAISALLFVAGPAQAASQNQEGAKKKTITCPCGGSKLCVGSKGGHYCLTPAGKKVYAKKKRARA